MNNKLKNEALDRPSIEAFKKQDKFPIILLLDDVRSLANVGSVFRTADAFNVEEIVLCGITGRPPHREIQRTALGATESVAWRFVNDIDEEIRLIQEKGYRIISLEQCEVSFSPKQLELAQDEKVALVLGNEVEGVRQSIIDVSDVVMEIPQSGTKHSLNVTVAAGIALWEIYAHFKAQD